LTGTFIEELSLLVGQKSVGKFLGSASENSTIHENKGFFSHLQMAYRGGFKVR